MKKILLFLSFLLMSIGVYADYTITFKTSGTTNLINTGGNYATSTETAYVSGTSNGVQFGSGSKGGSILLTMTASGQVKSSKITLNDYCKFASNGGDCKVTITFTDNSTENHTPSATTTATNTDVTITNNTKTLKSIKLESTAKNKRFYITGIKVTTSSLTPSHTLSSAVSPAASGSVLLSDTNVAEGSTATATATPANHYTFTSWSISGTGASLSSTTTNPTTVTMGTANATVTANFTAVQKASVTLSEAGTTTTDAITYYVGDTYTLPTTTEATCNGKVLVGWSTVEVDETDIKPISNYYEKGAEVTLSASQIFYAVFATVSAGGGSGSETLTGSEITSHFTSSAVAYGDSEKSWTDGTVTWAARFSAVSDGPYMQLKSDNNVYIKITAPSTITSVEMMATLTNCSGTGCNLDINEHSNATATISLQTAASGGTTVASGTAINKSIILNPSGNNSTLYIKVNGATKIWGPITVTYSSSSYSNYSTSCEIVPIYGVSLNKDTITLHIGNTDILAATVSPSNATNKSVTWSSLNDDIAIVSDGVVTGIAEGKTNVIVTTVDGSKTDTCTVIVLGGPSIDIAVWDTSYVKITIDNFNAATALLEDKDTQHTQEENVATKLFFSKYFEAASNIKLWAIYNGTKDTISLENVNVHVSSNGNAWSQKLNLSSYGHVETGWIYPNEEIIVYNHGNLTGTNAIKDTAIMNCVKKDYNIDEWYYHDGSTSFSGDDGILLTNGTDTLDVIGGINYSAAYTNTQVPSFGDGKGWYCEDGKTIDGDSTALSTNRCLLIRKNTVHSGSNAVTRNRDNFVTLCDEWVGAVVPSGNDSVDIANTCRDFAYVGDYDYNTYYAQFTEIVSDTALSQIIDADSTYKFTYNFTDLSCTELKVIVKDTTDKNDIKTHEETFRIPIFIYNDSTVKRFKEKNCKECDVIVMGGGVLNVDTVELENRNVTVYPGGRLVIPAGKEYKMNTLTLRRENNIVPHLLNNGTVTLASDSNYFFELRTDAADWRWMTLPANHKVSNIKEHNGKPIKLNTEVYIRHYDGHVRAINHKNGWDNAQPDSVFGTGQGFIYGVDLNGSKKKIYSFKFPNASVNTETSDKIITGLRAWGCNDESLAPNHKGWNLIGNPFTDNDTTDIITPIKTGELVKDSTVIPWNGKWVYKAGSEVKNLRYAVIPVTWRAWTADEAAAGGYASELLDDYVLLPFTSFFVQIGGNENIIQSLTVKPIGTNPINRIVARAPQYNEDKELFLRIRVGNRKTGCFISNKFTDEYEPGDDLESRYPIYQSIGGYKLLYSAINDSIIEHGVQVTAPQGTLYLDPKVDINKFEYIYAHYNDDWYDLKSGQTAEVNGTFILQAKRKTNDTPTSLEDVVKSNTTDKFIYNGHMYIRKNNHIYSVFGETIK